MRHHATRVRCRSEWTFVSVKHPCAICAGHDGCRRGFDDEFACCTRVSSEWPLSAGGWVHRVTRFSRATSHVPADAGGGAREELTLAPSHAQ